MDEALSARSAQDVDERSWDYLGFEGHRGIEIDQHGVIVQGLPIKVGVADDLVSSDKLIIALKDVLSQSHFDAAIGRMKDSRGSLCGATNSKFLKLPTHLWL